MQFKLNFWNQHRLVATIGTILLVSFFIYLNYKQRLPKITIDKNLADWYGNVATSFRPAVSPTENLLKPLSTTPSDQAGKSAQPCRINASAWNVIGGDRNWSVVFVDQQPGNRRRIDFLRLLPLSQIVATHHTDLSEYGAQKPNVTLADYTIPGSLSAIAQGGAPGAAEAFELASNVWRKVTKQRVARLSDEIIELAKIVRDEMDRLNAEFSVTDASGFGTHRALLLSSAVATKGAVLEMGMGTFSTYSLHRLVTEQDRYLESTETDMAWMSRFLNMSSENHVFKHVPVYLTSFKGDLMQFDC